MHHLRDNFKRNNMLLRILSVFLLFVGSATAVKVVWPAPSFELRPRISNGQILFLNDSKETVDVGEFPFLTDVSLGAKTPDKILHCAGALVNHREVLTSSKCIGSFSMPIIRIGSNYRDQGSQIKVDKIANYSINLEFDDDKDPVMEGLAILRTEKSLKFRLNTEIAFNTVKFYMSDLDFKNSNSIDKYVYYAPSFEPDFTTEEEKKGKVLQVFRHKLQGIKCPNDKTMSPNDYICARPFHIGSMPSGTLQEGTPLVQAQVKRGKIYWELRGIYVGNPAPDKLSTECKDKANSCTLKFLKVLAEPHRTWISEHLPQRVLSKIGNFRIIKFAYQ